MRNEYDFSKGERGAVAPLQEKTRITIMLDDDVIDAFQEQAESQGIGYQTAINAALQNAIGKENAPITIEILREVLRGEPHAS